MVLPFSYIFVCRRLYPLCVNICYPFYAVVPELAVPGGIQIYFSGEQAVFDTGRMNDFRFQTRITI